MRRGYFKGLVIGGIVGLAVGKMLKVREASRDNRRFHKNKDFPDLHNEEHHLDHGFSEEKYEEEFKQYNEDIDEEKFHGHNEEFSLEEEIDHGIDAAKRGIHKVKHGIHDFKEGFKEEISEELEPHEHKEKRVSRRKFRNTLNKRKNNGQSR